jgi:hypothetical protein
VMRRTCGAGSSTRIQSVIDPPRIMKWNVFLLRLSAHHGLAQG